MDNRFESKTLNHLRKNADLSRLTPLKDAMEIQRREHKRWIRRARWNGFKATIRGHLKRLLQELGFLPPSRAMRGKKYGWWGVCETTWNVMPGHGWDRVYAEPADVPEDGLYRGSNLMAVYGPYDTEDEALEAADPGNIYLNDDD